MTLQLFFLKLSHNKSDTESTSRRFSHMDITTCSRVEHKLFLAVFPRIFAYLDKEKKKT